MLNKLAKLSLVATSLAPILFTLWFVEINKEWDSKKAFCTNIINHWSDGIIYFVIAGILTLICWKLITLSKKNLEVMPVKIITVKTVDKEIIGFILVYLLPLINQTTTTVNGSVLIFVGILFFMIVSTSHSYHFNPLLGFLGYHFYEVNIEGGIFYVLISKQNITHSKSIEKVVQLTEYMILES